MPPAAPATRLVTPHTGASLASAIVLAAWLGAAIFFSAVVAQAAFQVLPTPTLAGALVGRTLPDLYIAGIVAGVVAAVLSLGVAPVRGLRVATALAAALLCAFGQFVIGARIDRLRASLGGPLESLPPSNALRIEFGRLHALSVAALGLAMLLALIALIATARSITFVPFYRD